MTTATYLDDTGGKLILRVRPSHHRQTDPKQKTHYLSRLHGLMNGVY